METRFRDDALARNQLALRVTFVWAVIASASLLIVGIMGLQLYKHKETHWLPLCTDGAFSIGESSYSSSYLQQMAKKVADLRLTYNPETVVSRYRVLTHLATPSMQEALNQQLRIEISAIKKKNISSVFYPESIAVDTAHNSAKLKGLLHRSSHGLQLSPVPKIYLIKFVFQSGVLSPVSIEEVSHEKS